MKREDSFLKNYIADVSILTDDILYKKAYLALPDFRQQKVDRLKPAAAKRLSIGAGLLIKHAFSEINHMDSLLKYKENPKGKPYIEGEEIYFNLSHSGDKVMCCISNEEMGCDIQLEDNKSHHIAFRCFHQNECDYIYDGYDAESIRNKDITDLSDEDLKIINDRFFTIWCRKEAYVKLSGDGLSRDFREFNVLDMDECFTDFCHQDYHMAVCQKSRIIDTKLSEILLENII